MTFKEAQKSSTEALESSEHDLKIKHVSVIIIQGGTQSRQKYIPRNADPKGGGAQGVITGAETGGEHTSSADRCAEE